MLSSNSLVYKDQIEAFIPKEDPLAKFMSKNLISITLVYPRVWVINGCWLKTYYPYNINFSILQSSDHVKYIAT